MNPFFNTHFNKLISQTDLAFHIQFAHRTFFKRYWQKVSKSKKNFIPASQHPCGVGKNWGGVRITLF
jgi:hypothetical protein